MNKSESVVSITKISTSAATKISAELNVSGAQPYPSDRWILQIINDAATWLDIKQIARLSDISQGRCKVIAEQLLAHDCIASKIKSGPQFPDGVTVYGKKSVAQRELDQQQSADGFRYAKSRFECRPEILEGNATRPYSPTQSQTQKLAMLSRK
jgi:hypothetical protein